MRSVGVKSTKKADLNEIRLKSTKKADLNEISRSYCRLLRVVYIHGERKEEKSPYAKQTFSTPRSVF